MKTICVYAGSSPGNKTAFTQQAKNLAQTLIENDITLIYGGGKLGLMGVIADSMLTQGGRVIGVIPETLVKMEVAHDSLSELFIVDSMHERKAKMIELSEGFIALPGGLGTFEEIFEVLSWAQLNLHQKPCGLLNTDNYYDLLIQFLTTAVSNGFIKKDHLSMLLIENNPTTLIEKFLTYVSSKMSKV